MEEIMCPIFDYIFSESGFEYLDEGFNCLNGILYSQNSISERIWFYFPILNYLIVGIEPTQSNQETMLKMEASLRVKIENVQESLGDEQT